MYDGKFIPLFKVEVRTELKLERIANPNRPEGSGRGMVDLNRYLVEYCRYCALLAGM
jgi:hypothetical protein